VKPPQRQLRCHRPGVRHALIGHLMAMVIPSLM